MLQIPPSPDSETAVQLSDLLGRLAPDERAILVERRLGPNAVPLDDRALADQLATTNSTSAALGRINAGQLLLLRWLGARPGTHASWPELTEALGDRLSPALLEQYLHDLRLWGLADFDPDPTDGFFATYPAVASRLPTGRIVGLRPSLSILNSDILLKVCQALGATRPPTRKDDRIEVIASTLTDPATCRAAVDRLTPGARDLFEWVRSEGGWVGAEAMNARVPRQKSGYGYGSSTLEAFWRGTARDGQFDPLTEAVRCMLIVPVMPYAGAWYAPSAYAVAAEVEQALTSKTLLDGPLQSPPLEPATPVDPVIPIPINLVRDIGHLLGFIAAGRCEWKQDGQPYKRSLVALGKLLGYNDKDATYAELLWNLAESARLLRPTYDGSQSRFEPARLGDEITATELYVGLILAWVQTGAHTSPIGAQARAHVLELLGLLPADTWLRRASVEAVLRFTWPMMFAPEYRASYAPPSPGWSTLGSILIGHGSDRDGKPAIMLPAAHQRMLDPEGDTVPDVLPPWDSTWVVQPDRTIVVPPNAHPEAVAALWMVAQLQSSQGASVFRVTPDSIAAAMNQGLSPNEIRSLLQGGSKVPLPPTVERLIDDQGQKYGRIKVGAARTYVTVDDPALLAELKRHAKLKKLTWVDVAPGAACIVSHDPEAVLSSLKQAGYLPVMDEAKPSKALLAAATPRLRAVGGRQRTTRAAPPLVTGREALVAIVKEAGVTGMPLTVTWLTGGHPHIAEIEVIDLHDDEIHGYNLGRDGVELLIPLDAVVDVMVEPDDEDDL
jgi:hypothetical protein